MDASMEARKARNRPASPRSLRAIPFLLLLLPAALAACGDSRPRAPTGEGGPHEQEALVSRVDPFIGTGGIPWASGMVFPGATVPFGMVRLSPDTSFAYGLRIGAMGTAGYYYGHTHLLGFSHTRLSGTGAVEGGFARVIPARAGAHHSTRYLLPIPFSHSGERASPGYYAVDLASPGVSVELTATTRVGLHRYTFGPGGAPMLLLDATSALGSDTRVSEGRIEILHGGREVVGEARLFGAFSGRYGGLKGYFAARFSVPFDSFGTWEGDDLVEGRLSAQGEDVGAALRFGDGTSTTVVEVKMGISFVSVENARLNLDAEAGQEDFDAVRRRAEHTWEQELGRIRVRTADPEIEETFYSALYHCLLMPTSFTDVNGAYLGFNREVGTADDFTYVTDLSLWDTFRNEHSLLTLVAPEVQRDSLKSLVRMARLGGTLPRWPSGGGYTGSMLGTPADMVIAESYLKGIDDFEVEEAYEYMKRTALGPPPAGADGREGIEECMTFGYCPADRMEAAVSRTLEYAWADASIAALASALNKPEEAALFRDRSHAWRLQWNPASRYFQPRNADGSWAEPFLPDMTTYLDELFGTHFVDDYVEGSPKHWRWAVPQDTQGLIDLFGSPEYFVSELEAFMKGASAKRGDVYPGPNYWHGNEHDFHAIYLFDDAGRPDLAQKWVRWALTDRYGTGPDGLDGNDDGGALSAWYVFSALGFYPIAGSDSYWIGAPIVEQATVSLQDGAALEVIALGQAPGHPYVQKVTLNGEPLCSPRLHHGAIASGGVLEFVMGPRPAPGGGFACP